MEPLSIEAILMAMGLSLKNVLAAAVGAFISLRFFEGVTGWERWTTFISGTALGAWLSAPIIIFFEQKPSLEVGLALMLGLFGLAIAAKLWQIVRETVWVEFLFRMINVVRGRNGNGTPPPSPPPSPSPPGGGGNFAPPSQGGPRS